MSTKSQNANEPWVDSDDAPELGDEFFDKGVWKVGDKTVSRVEARAAAAKLRGLLPDKACFEHVDEPSKRREK